MHHETKEHWREKLGIELGMSRTEALDKFLEWKDKQHTCDRCEEGKHYQRECPIVGPCTQAKERRVEDEGNGDLEVGATDLGEGTGQGVKNFPGKSCRVSAERVSLVKHRGPRIFSRANLHDVGVEEPKP